jgi:hypothetical protein
VEPVGDRAAEQLDEQQQHTILEDWEMKSAKGFKIESNQNGLYDLTVIENGREIRTVKNISLKRAETIIEQEVTNV